MTGTPRVFAAAFGVEVNAFSPLATGRHDFAALSYHPAGTLGAAVPLIAAPFVPLRRLAQGGAITLVEGMVAGAQPGGPLTRATYEALAGELLGDLAAAGPVDCVVLGLHGAMSAQGLPDCDGDLIARVRAMIGPKAVLAVLFDSHGTLSQAMLDGADLLVCYKEYPHTDIAESAEKLVRLALAATRGDIAPRVAVHDCRMISVYHTMHGPMQALVAELRAREARGLALDISVVHGFIWADTPDTSAKVIVTTDGDAPAAARIAGEIGARLRALAGTTHAPLVAMAEAVRCAAAPRAAPLVLADTADNPGGGAPSDSTWLLRALAAAGVGDVAAGIIWDPAATELALAAGPGARLDLRIGGKACALSGDPLDLEVHVLAAAEAASVPFAGSEWPMGQAAGLHVPALDWYLVVSARRTQCFAPEAFTRLGIDPAQRRVVLVKSSQHFYAAFQPLAGEVLIVDAPGVLDHDPRRLPYRHVTRPIWPLDP
ncbi:M81 family metallopeptidase [Erythrobacter sp. NE805]|uniref:M81 family metallopeptidase n=1 Tax=Erythrobacter sp. NE805 TaxID=3389875 RepID=UPI00396B3B64